VRVSAEETPLETPLETTVREYKRARDYERDVRQRRREGWRVVSVLQRPGSPGGLRRFAVGSGLARPETEYLVTYNRVAHEPRRPRPLEWLTHPHLPRARSTRWLWLVIAALLVLLLAYGFADFFADAVPF
jgi:hypothetical protein